MAKYLSSGAASVLQLLPIPQHAKFQSNTLLAWHSVWFIICPTVLTAVLSDVGCPLPTTGLTTYATLYRQHGAPPHL